jgi:hypothetical protein
MPEKYIVTFRDIQDVCTLVDSLVKEINAVADPLPRVWIFKDSSGRIDAVAFGSKVVTLVDFWDVRQFYNIVEGKFDDELRKRVHAIFGVKEVGNEATE